VNKLRIRFEAVKVGPKLPSHKLSASWKKRKEQSAYSSGRPGIGHLFAGSDSHRRRSVWSLVL
jgi:hypothetical protein